MYEKKKLCKIIQLAMNDHIQDQKIGLLLKTIHCGNPTQPKFIIKY